MKEKRISRDDIESIKQRVMEATIKILTQHLSSYMHYPNSKTCIRHYHLSVISGEIKMGRNTLLLGAMQIIHSSPVRVNKENEAHSLITLCERQQFSLFSASRAHVVIFMIPTFKKYYYQYGPNSLHGPGWRSFPPRSVHPTLPFIP